VSSNKKTKGLSDSHLFFIVQITVFTELNNIIDSSYNKNIDIIVMDLINFYLRSLLTPSVIINQCGFSSDILIIRSPYIVYSFIFCLALDLHDNTNNCS